MRAIEAVREQIKAEEFDYLMLMQALAKYRKPRDAVSRLLREGSILRIKKGLYVFGERYRRGMICKEALANLIYGPSYLSLEYALAYHGLIPERVEIITSITPLRPKSFPTALGVFEYVHLHHKKIAVGVTLREVDALHQFLIATPEKALSDKIAFYTNLNSSKDVRAFVCEGLRIEEDALAKFRTPLLEEIAEVYNNSAVESLCRLVREIKC